MSRFSAITLDLSRFPPPLALGELSLEDVLAARIARAEEVFAERGLPWNVKRSSHDTVVALQRVDNWRELLVRGDVNDAVKAGLIAFATGTDLDHQGLTAALNLPRGMRDLMLRREMVPASGSTPAVMESDAEYRRRLLLSPEAAAAGTEGGYLFHALSADTRVVNADVWTPERGEAVVALQARAGLAAAPIDVIAAVHAHLHRKDVKPLTDAITVRSVTTHGYRIAVVVYVQPGPDPLAVKALVEDSLSAMALARRLPGRDVPMSAIIAAATAGPVDRVVLADPLADVVMQRGQLAVCEGISVEVRSHDG